MRISMFGLGLVALLALGAPVQARPMLQWCAFMNDTEVTDCFYRTFEECRVTIFGVGGHCFPNPFYEPAPVKRKRRHAR